MNNPFRTRWVPLLVGPHLLLLVLLSWCVYVAGWAADIELIRYFGIGMSSGAFTLFLKGTSNDCTCWWEDEK